jgi:hypothetical protein
MLRIVIIATILFVTTTVHAQLGGFSPPGVPNIDPRHPPNLGQVIQQLNPNSGGGPAPAGTPGLPGSPVKIDCPLDKLVDAAKSLEDLAKNHANDVKNFNDQMAATAKNVGEAQLTIIKKTTEEAGKVLLKPFDPLIDVAKHFLEYYNWLKDKLERLAWQVILIAGAVFGFLFGLPFWMFIRAITPRRKPA